MTSQMDEDLFEIANFSPLYAAKECRQKIAHLEHGYHAKLRHCVAEAYAVAYSRQISPAMAASKIWRRLQVQKQLPKVIQAFKFQDGIEVTRGSSR